MAGTDSSRGELWLEPWSPGLAECLELRVLRGGEEPSHHTGHRDTRSPETSTQKTTINPTPHTHTS